MNNGKVSEQTFEHTYLRLRELENRILPDELVLVLPQIKDGQHANEWKLRAKSSARFTQYLASKPNIKTILEIGCGNGWFANQIALATSAQVIGSDINTTELEQAARLFKKKQLSFKAFDLFQSSWSEAKPNLIVFNASIQYFPQLTLALNKAIDLLAPGGEIHIIDSPFYKRTEVLAAKQRSTDYFEKMKVAEMANHYYHHSLPELKTFKPAFHYRPLKFPFNRIIKDTPFPWVSISKHHE